MTSAQVIKSLEAKIAVYQKKMLVLAKDASKADSRYGNEYDNEQIRVYQSLVTQLKKEIITLKRRPVGD